MTYLAFLYKISYTLIQFFRDVLFNARAKSHFHRLQKSHMDIDKAALTY